VAAEKAELVAVHKRVEATRAAWAAEAAPAPTQDNPLRW